MTGVDASELRTGLLIPVHAADELVHPYRRRHNAVSVARRLPPHITVLFPFARAVTVDEQLHLELADLYRAVKAFEAELVDVGSFDEFVWLAPEPRDRFVDLIRLTTAHFPAYPPYESPLVEPWPHLTIAAVDPGTSAESLLESARRELGPRLPFRFTVDHVALFEERADETWRAVARFDLR